MAYDAGSVVFTFEADTTQIDKALQDVKKAYKNISSSSSSYKSKNTVNWSTQDLEKMNKQYDAAASQTNRIGVNMAAASAVLTTITASVNDAKNTVKNIYNISSDIVSKSLKSCVTTIKTIGNLSSTLLSTSSKFVTTIGEIAYKFSGIEGTVNTLKSLFSALGDTISETFSIDSISDFISECIDLGASLTEIQNVVDVVFDDNASTIDSWAESATSTLGVSELTAKTLSGTYGSILDTAGISSEYITEMSQNLTNLTTDIASFRDSDVDTVFEKIKSGLTGQTKPLKEYGISMEAASIQAWMTAEGINATYTELSYAEKELIRYNYLLDQTTEMQGDYQKTFYTWSNQIKYFKEVFDEIKSTIGNLITAYLRPLLIILNKIMDKINAALDEIYEKLKAIGEEWGGIWSVLFDGLTSDTDTSDYSDLLEDMEEDIDNVNDAVKRTVSSFDELHRLNDDDDSSSSSLDLGLDNYDTTDWTSKYEDDIKTIGDYIDELIDKIKLAWETGNAFDLGVYFASWLNKITDSIYDFLKDLISTSKKLGTFVASFINGFLSEYDFNKLGQTISKAIENVQDALLSFIEELEWDDVGNAFADFIEGLLTISDEDSMNIITRGFKVLKETINGIIEALDFFIATMDENDTWDDLATSISDGINSLFGEDGIDWDKMGSTIRNLIMRVLDVISTVIEQVDWTTVGESIGIMLANLFDVDKNGESIFTKLGTTIRDLFNMVLDLIKSTFSNEDLAKNSGVGIADFINSLFTIDEGEEESAATKIFTTLKTIINFAIQSFSSFLSEMSSNGTWTKIQNSIIDGINSLFGEDGIDFETLGSNIRNLFIRIFETMSIIITNINWDDVATAFSDLFSNIFGTDANGNSVLGKLGTTLNKFIKSIGTVISNYINNGGFDELIESVKQFFSNLMDDWDWDQITKDVQTVIDKIKEVGETIMSKVSWGDLLAIAVSIIKELLILEIEKIGIILIAVIASVLYLIFEAIVGIIENLWGIIETVLTGIVTNVVGLVTTLIDLLEELFYNFFVWWDESWSTIIEELKTDWDSIKTWLSETWTSIWTTLKNGLSNTWNSIKSKLTSAWNWIKTNIFDAIKNGVKSMLNTVISTINSLISKLNSISFTMPDWLGGGTFGLSIPTLPLLANGGYIGADMPTAAIIGDNKNEGEIVAPESKIQENVAIALEPYMSKIESLLSTLINSSDEIHVHCEIDGDEITEIVLNNANLATARGGA